MITKLPPEVKTKWLEALRSGKYTQTQGVLRRDKPADRRSAGHCCLGVLCDVIDPTRWMDVGGGISAWGERSSTAFPNADYIPHPVYLSLSSRVGGDTMVASFLAAQNDDGKWNFNQIATWIEENL